MQPAALPARQNGAAFPAATTGGATIESVPIAVVGSGVVGLVAAAGFAEIGHSVVCVECDAARLHRLRSGQLPLHEPYLQELLHDHALSRRIRFTGDLAEATRQALAIFIAVGTPQNADGTADLSHVEAAVVAIARALLDCDGRKVIVEKSTVPVCTGSRLRSLMEAAGLPTQRFDIASNPEFLREGTAVADFLHPDRIVIGVDSDHAAGILRRIYQPLTSGSYYLSLRSVPGPRSGTHPPPLLQTSTRAAEIIKHASNAFLATKISFINAVANICEAAGADVHQVAQGIGMDSRIGPHFLRPGIGYGGSCLPKDVAAFRCAAEKLGAGFPLLAEVERINEQQQDHFLRALRSVLPRLHGARLGVLGLAFKGGTDDVRNSPAIDLVRRLLREGAILSAYDPAAMENARAILPPSPQIAYVNDVRSAAQDADALLILTDWPQFATLNLAMLHTALRQPVVADGRSLYDPRLMARHGFAYLSIGRPALHPALEAEVQRLR